MTGEQLTNDDGPFICETINWTNCTGTNIVEYEVRSGVPPEGFARFRMQVVLKNEEGQPLVQKVATIEAESIEEAFAMAPAVLPPPCLGNNSNSVSNSVSKSQSSAIPRSGKSSGDSPEQCTTKSSGLPKGQRAMVCRPGISSMVTPVVGS